MVVKLKHVSKKILRNWRLKALVIAIVLAGFGAGVLVSNYLDNKRSTDLQNQYNLLSRRILIDNPNDVLIDFRSLQNEYRAYLQRNNLDDKVSIYFEYLPTGSSIGIHESKESLGASLLKLPLAISFYKLVEEGKLSLDTTVPLKKEWLNSSYGSLYQKGEGYQISYREAIKYALEQSDNTAALTIFDAVSTAQGTKTPNVMGFVDANYATTPSEEILIGVQSYTSILKCLYFSCYLNRDDSQDVLRQLTHSEADNRLTLYTPSDLKVAHKIGTYQTLNQSDCGIFYVPKRNYALCVMVQEEDPAASRVIGDLSLMTYQYLAPDTDSTAGE